MPMRPASVGLFRVMTAIARHDKASCNALDAVDLTAHIKVWEDLRPSVNLLRSDTLGATSLRMTLFPTALSGQITIDVAVRDARTQLVVAPAVIAPRMLVDSITEPTPVRLVHSLLTVLATAFAQDLAAVACGVSRDARVTPQLLGAGSVVQVDVEPCGGAPGVRVVIDASAAHNVTMAVARIATADGTEVKTPVDWAAVPGNTAGAKLCHLLLA